MWRNQSLSVAILMLGMGLPVWTQSTHPIFPTPPRAADSMVIEQRTKSPDLEKLRLAAEQQKMQLLKDANRLNQLASELTQAVNKAPAGTLSMDAVKKTREIEKLAKRLDKELRGE